MAAMGRVRRWARRWMLPVVAMAFCALALAQAGGKRLVMKDGSYQGVREYQVQGERVRYLSSERGEWEEVPSALVDWKATEEWNKPKENPALKRLSDEEEAERRALAEQTPSVAPGVRLPVDGGVWLLDDVDGRHKLVELLQAGSELNKNTGKNVLRATVNPLAGTKETFELKDAHAKTQIGTRSPEIYISIDGDGYAPKLDATDRFRILRLDSTRHDTRVLASTKMSFYGKVSQQENVIGTRAEKYSGPWVKLIPLDDIPPGEYAVVEMLSTHDMNMYVWDFGVEK